MKKLKAEALLFLRCTANSYSQVFFSDNLVFAVLLIMVTFFDAFAGFCGLLSVLITNLLARALHFHPETIRRGLLGFNSLLVGLGLGIYFGPGWLFFLILVLASVFTLFISMSLQGVIGKYGLPALSMPFILSLWLVFLATKDFTALGISDRGIYALNDLYLIGGNRLVALYEWWNSLAIPESLRTYFISLGAIFFQYSVLSGIMIALGLLYFSRIAFSLSLIGFYTAYLFYHIIGADLNSFNYSYIGFNYILTSIAIGGFFLIPSRSSYLWTLFLIPLVAIITISLNKIFLVFGLSIYALPFNLIVLLFLYVLKFRTRVSEGIREVWVQYNQPEKNLYTFKNESDRFRYLQYFPVKLPFWGEWIVSQGHDGEYTHKDEWKHAWDFVIQGNDEKTFKNEGENLEDYHCFNKSVTAPGEGVVEEVVDDVHDNPVGEVNLQQNWGNTIVIKHQDGLYSKLSHLKKGTVSVKPGDRVKEGQVIARVGNSGRSPYPHLHFQLQATPYIGSATLDYPISYFIRNTGNNYCFCMHQKPARNWKVSNIQLNPLLQKSFRLIPGQHIRCEYTYNLSPHTEEWEINTDAYNKSYIHCRETGARAYFHNDGSLFYFTHYQGKRSGLLYYFYLSFYKIPLGFYKNLKIHDSYPVHFLFSRARLFLQDFLAPFFMFLGTRYTLEYIEQDDDMSPVSISLKVLITTRFLRHPLKQIPVNITLETGGIYRMEINAKKDKIHATCTVI